MELADTNGILKTRQQQEGDWIDPIQITCPARAICSMASTVYCRATISEAVEITPAQVVEVHIARRFITF